VGGGDIQGLPLVNENYPDTGPWWPESQRPNISQVVFTSPAFGRARIHSLFRGLPNLTTIENINYIDLANTLWTSQMFRGASNLTTINGLDVWDVGGVQRFSGMFRDATALTSLDLRNWDMGSAQRLDSMFRGTSLTEVIGINHWDTSHVQWMSWMFMDATGFTRLDLSDWDTSGTLRMAEMFHGASNLTEIVGINHWDTSHVQTIASIFRGANSLTSLDLSNWDTSSIGTNPSSATAVGMASAFRGMANLAHLNIEGWDTRHLTDAQMHQMFSGSNSLSVLTLGENWVAQGTPNQQGLVTPSGPNYTGRWQNVGDGTVDNPLGDQRLTPDELMYGTTGAGETWVWERVEQPSPGEPGEPRLPERQAYLIGTDRGLIRPNANITRAEVATIFFRLIDDTTRARYWLQTNPFPDVEMHHWFNNAVSTTTHAGIFQGRPDGTFAPNQAITRAELTTAVARFMNIAGFAPAEADLFSDIYGHWASSYINAMAVNNWVQGPSGQGGAFYPDRPVTRAETAAIINRIFGRLQESPEDLLPNMLTWPDNANVNAWYYLYIQSATNSYTYSLKPDGIHERWVAMIPTRNWAALERPESVPASIFS
jgi:surface protein